jgi:phenylacetate-CoA ligase
MQQLRSRAVLPTDEFPASMTPAEFGHALQRLTAQLQQSERLSAHDLAQLQSEALASLIAHHLRHTPAFAARLRRAKLGANDVNSVATLVRLAPLARRDIQDLGASFHSRQIPAGHEPVGTTTTSGSTGEPVTVRRSGQCRLYWAANTARDHRWNGRKVTDRLLSIRPSIPARTEGDWGFPMASLGRTGPSLGLPTAMDLAEHLRNIDEFQPQTLLVFPNVLGGLLDEWERRGHAPPALRHIKTVGETVSAELRERTRRICELPIEDSYSSQECGVIAVQCTTGGLFHIMAESVVVEVLDSAGHPCPPGQSGRIVVTDLRNFASPMIRYDIGDIAVRGEPCACGLQLPTLQSIMGRDRNLVARPDGSRRYAIVGFHEFQKVADVLQFRCIQHSLQEIELIVHTRGTRRHRADCAGLPVRSAHYPHRNAAAAISGREVRGFHQQGAVESACRARPRRSEVMADFAIGCAFPVVAARIHRHHVSPEADSRRIARILEYFPTARESVEYESHGAAPDAPSPGTARHEELRHAELRFPRCVSLPRHHCKTRGLLVIENGEQRGRPIHQPALQLVGLAVADLAQRRKDPGVQQAQVIEIVAIHALDPLKVPGIGARIAQAYRHVVCPSQIKNPDRIFPWPGFMPVRLRSRTGRLC